MRLIVRARRAESALNHKAGNDSMKRGVIVPAAFDKLQKIAYVFRRKLRVHLECYVDHARVKQNILAHLINGRIFERLELLAFDLDADNPDGLNSKPVAVGW